MSVAGGYDQGDQLGSSGQQRTVVNTNDGICPLTIHQILTAQFDTNLQEVRIDGITRKQVCIVGRVISHSGDAMEIIYTINDGTGSFNVKYFAADISVEVYPEGTLVCVTGRLSATNQKEITAFTIRKIKEADQIPFHMLQATFVHLQAIKGAAPNSVFSAHVTQPQAVAQHSAQAIQQMTSEQRADKIKEDVIECIKREVGESGVSVQTVISQLSSKYSVEEIKTAVENASFNGEIYPTNEDDHYAPC